MSKIARWRVFVVASFAVALLLGFWVVGGERLAAAVNGDVVLDYDEQIIAAWDEKEVVRELRVWNASFDDMEIMGISSPCPDCIKAEPIPTTIPQWHTGVIRIRFPLDDVPPNQKIALHFRLLCNRRVENNEFLFSLYRQAKPNPPSSVTRSKGSVSSAEHRVSDANRVLLKGG
jgi:hypothetical protein